MTRQKRAQGDRRLQVWEFPKGSGIKVRVRINTSGTLGFRVSLPTKLTGKSTIELKQFPTKDKAFNWAETEFIKYQNFGKKAQELNTRERLDALEAKKLLQPHGLGIESVVRQYLNSVEKLEGTGLTLDECIQYAVSRLRPESGDKTLSEIIHELQMIKETYRLRPRSLKDFRTRSGKLLKGLGDAPVREIEISQLVEWLQGMSLSPRSRRNYMMTAGEIFRYAKEKRYILDNPFDSLTRYERKSIEGIDGAVGAEPKILTVEQAQNLIATAAKHPDLGMLPAVTLACFCGIRTEELKRMEWEEVKLDDAQPFVVIPATKAKKRRIRHVPIPENAAEWLSRCRQDEGPIIISRYESDYQKRFYKLQQLAGLGESIEEEGKTKWRSTWQPNSMRHSFGTYDYALHGDSIRTARLLGHKGSEDDVLFEHYRALARKTDGEAYFSIRPQ